MARRGQVALLGLIAALGQPAFAQAPATEAPLVVSVGYTEEAGPRDFVEQYLSIRKGQRLSRQAVQRSIDRLFATGRYADIIVRATDVPEGVALVFEIVVKKALSEVKVAGTETLTAAAVLAASKLTEGSEYYPERLDIAEREVKALYLRRGFAHAVVNAELEESDQGLGVTIRVTEGKPTFVESIVFGGGPGLPTRRLLAALDVKLGDVLDLDKVGAGLERVRALYRAARFYKARISPPVVEQGARGGRLFIPVAAGPQYAVQFHGNRSYSAKALLETLRYDGSETLDTGLMGLLAQKVATFYIYRGFHDVDVTAHETDSPTRQRALLVFEVEEADPLFVREVRFEGNQALSSSELERILVDRIQAGAPATLADLKITDDPLDIEGETNKPPARSEPDPDPITVYVDEAYLEAAQAMQLAYRDKGFSGAVVTLDKVAIDVRERAVNVRFRIVEGTVTKVAEIAVPGAPADVAASEVVGIKAGQVLEGGTLEGGKTALLRALGHKGYLFAQVEAASTLLADGAHLRFKVEAGQRVRVGKIIVQGAGKREAAVRANLTVHEDALLDPDTLYASQRNLVAMGDFSTVAVHLIAPDQAEGVKDVVVELEPASRYSYGAGVGYTLVEGPLVQADVAGPDVGQTAAEGLSRLAATFRGWSGGDARVRPEFGWLSDALAETSFAVRGRVSYVGLSALTLGLPGSPPIITCGPQSGLPCLTSSSSEVAGFKGLGGRVNLALQHPLIYALLNQLPGKVGWRLDVVAERVFRPSYRFYRGAVVGSLDWRYQRPGEPDAAWAFLRYFQAGRYTLTFQAEPEYVIVRTQPDIAQILATLAPSEQTQLRFPQGNFALMNLRATPTADFRDDPTNPHRGLLVTVPTEFTNALSASALETDPSGQLTAVPITISTMKVSGNITEYVALGPTWVLAMSVRAGKIFRVDPNSQTIPPKRFYLGGSNSMRGFGEDEVIPEDQRQEFETEARNCNALGNKAGCTLAAQSLLAGNQIPPQGGEIFELAKIELRFPFPLAPSWDTGIFCEAGNLWLDQSQYSLSASIYTLRYDAGFSFRKPTPIGPIALGLGFNLNAARDAIRTAAGLQPVGDTLNEPIWNFNFSVGQF